jgi:uncharacterized protein
MSLEFEWDAAKSDANAKKHGVAFEEAITVFADPPAQIFDDPDHSGDQHREIIIGHSVKQQLLLVCFTEREATIRIISAPSTTRRGHQDYEENKQGSS